MKTLLLLLALALRATAALHFTEPWLEARVEKEGRAAWGAHHVWLERGPSAQSFEEGLPEGVLSVVENEGAWWAVLASGSLRRLGAEGRDVWSLGHTLRGAAVEADGAVWLLDDEGLTLVRLHGTESPEARCRMAHHGGAGTLELRAGDGHCLLQDGRRLLRLRPGSMIGLGHLPAGVEEWAPWQGGLLYLDNHGRANWLEQSQRAACLEPEAMHGGPLPERSFRRLLSLGKTLWLQEESGAWWRWLKEEPEARALALTCSEGRAESWLPAGDGTLLCESAQERQWWTEAGGVWILSGRATRPRTLRARLVRQGGDWCLEENGQLWQGGQGQWSDRGLHSAALSLWRGGAGPWLQHGEGLKVFSEGGAHIGGWAGPCERAGALLEDYLLVAGGDSLRVFWTSEEDPWLQATLPLPDVEELRTSPLGAAALAEGQVHWVDLTRPWLPRLEMGSPAPEGLQDMLLAEDRLLLATQGGLKAWTRRQGQWESTGCELEGQEARWLCQRGADRVLALSATGRLGQWRLVDNLPQHEEWSLRLPVTGRISFERDSLRILGDAGWGDWPLPALASFPNGPAGESPLLDAGTSAPLMRRQGTRLLVELPAKSARVVRIHDLLGRQVAQAPVHAGRAGLPLEGLATGTYLLSVDDGSAAAHPFTWVK